MSEKRDCIVTENRTEHDAAPGCTVCYCGSMVYDAVSGRWLFRTWIQGAEPTLFPNEMTA